MQNKEKQFFWTDSKNQIYIISAIFGIIILFLILFFVFPYLEEVKKNSEDLVSGRNNLAYLEKQVSQVEKFKINYQSYKPNLEKIDQLYLDSKNPADFFKFLEKTAQDCQVKLEVSLLSSPKDTTSISFQIFSQGDFSKIIKFLEKLETGPYLIEIQNLSITSSSQDNTSKKSVNANFLVKVYIKPILQ